MNATPRPVNHLLLLALAMLVASSRSWGGDEPAGSVTMTKIEVVVDIPTVREEGDEWPRLDPKEVAKVLARANEILKQAGILLDVKATHHDAKDPAANHGNADGNAQYTEKEVGEAKKKGALELDKALKKKDEPEKVRPKGIKVYFGAPAKPSDTSNAKGRSSGSSGGGSGDTTYVAGRAEHHHRVVFVDPAWPGIPHPDRHPDDEPPDLDDVALDVTGERLAHEVIHALSVIHHHHGDPKNVMSPVIDINTPPATRMTTAQIDEVQKVAKQWGEQTVVPAPGAAPAPKQHTTGGREDERKADGDDDATGPDHADVKTVAMYGIVGEPTVTFQVLTEGRPRTGDVLDVSYRWLLDVDALPFTGATVAGRPGIDREVRVSVLGLAPVAPFVEAVMIDHAAGGALMPLDDPVWVTEPVLLDPGGPVPAFQRIAVEVPTWMFEPIEDGAPCALVVTDVAGVDVYDTVEYVYDVTYTLFRSTLEIDPPLVERGGTVTATATGLEPGSSATVRIDDEVRVEDVPVAPDGTVEVELSMCTLPTADSIYFVSIEDDAGSPTAWSVVQVAAPLEDLESYPPGSQLHGQGGWKGWNDDPAFSAPVTELVARTGTQSIDVSGAADLVREECASGAGAWSFSAWQYIPSSFDSSGGGSPAGSYFILLNTYQDGGPYHWSVQIGADSTIGMLKVVHGDGLNTVNVPYDTDRWVKIQCIIDLDDDWTRVYYDDELVTEYPWTGGVLGGGGGALDIAVVDLYANGATSIYYDDLRLEPINGCGKDLESDADGDGDDLLTEFLNGSDPCGG